MLVEICIPAKNEELILRSNVLRLISFLKEKNFNYSWQIIVIVNGSTDKSKDIIEKIEKENKDFLKIKNIKEGGKGRALKTYFSESIADILVFMDADLSASLDDLESLINPLVCENFDISMGSRLLSESKIDRSFLRRTYSVLYNIFSRFVLGHDFSDLQCGFKAFTKKVVKHILPMVKDDNWFFDTEFIVLSKHFGYKIKEIPIDWKENRYFRRKTTISIFAIFYFIKNTFLFKEDLKRLEGKNYIYLIHQIFLKYKKIFRYIISGGIATCLNIVVLFICVHYYDLWYLTSAIISFCFAVVVSYLLQKFWTFKNYLRENISKQFFIFFIFALSMLLLNTLLMYLFVEIIGFYYLIAQITVSLIIGLASYAFHSKLIFK
jgi:putative flippase GtrA